VPQLGCVDNFAWIFMDGWNKVKLKKRLGLYRMIVLTKKPKLRWYNSDNKLNQVT